MQHTKQATEKAIGNFATDVFAQKQFRNLIGRGIEPAKAVRIIINEYIESQGDFGGVVGWAEADQVDTAAVAGVICLE